MYRRIETLDEIFRTKRRVCWLGGGTDLIPLVKLGVRKAADVADFTHIRQLREISDAHDGIFIGSAVTLAEIADEPAILARFPALVQSAKRCASPQIRSVATIGGNVMQDRRCIYFNQSVEWRSSFAPCFKTGGTVCHQNPYSQTCRAIYYSDAATSLVLYDAVATIIENGKQLNISISELIERHSRVSGGMQKGSVFFILGFHILHPPKDEHSLFFKYSLRSSVDFPVVNFGVRFSGGKRPAKIVAGAVAGVPLILERSAKRMDEKSCQVNTITSAATEELAANAQLLRESVITPKIKAMSFGLIEDVIRKCLERYTSQNCSS